MSTSALWVQVNGVFIPKEFQYEVVPWGGDVEYAQQSLEEIVEVMAESPEMIMPDVQTVSDEPLSAAANPESLRRHMFDVSPSRRVHIEMLKRRLEKKRAARALNKKETGKAIADKSDIGSLLLSFNKFSVGKRSRKPRVTGYRIKQIVKKQKQTQGALDPTPEDAF